MKKNIMINKMNIVLLVFLGYCLHAGNKLSKKKERMIVIQNREPKKLTAKNSQENVVMFDNNWHFIIDTGLENIPLHPYESKVVHTNGVIIIKAIAKAHEIVNENTKEEEGDDDNAKSEIYLIPDATVKISSKTKYIKLGLYTFVGPDISTLIQVEQYKDLPN